MSLLRRFAELRLNTLHGVLLPTRKLHLFYLYRAPENQDVLERK